MDPERRVAIEQRNKQESNRPAPEPEHAHNQGHHAAREFARSFKIPWWVKVIASKWGVRIAVTALCAAVPALAVYRVQIEAALVALLAAVGG